MWGHEGQGERCRAATAADPAWAACPNRAAPQGALPKRQNRIIRLTGFVEADRSSRR
jgi:hypothetical protein